MIPARFGFVGLGDMGGPMAANIAAAGFDLIVYDKAGTEARTPDGARAAASLADVGGAADTARPASAAAEQAHAVLAGAGVAYVDAPVSGGQAGARAGTVTVMWSGSAALLESHRAVLEAMARNALPVGDRAGQGQAMKLINNFLSATAMAATSEAMAFGLAQGLQLQTMLDVVNVSTGRNTATTDKFPNRIQTGTYDAGFQMAHMAKDVRLYLETVRARDTPAAVGAAVADLWRRADAAMPGSDFTRIYEFVRGGEKA